MDGTWRPSEASLTEPVILHGFRRNAAQIRQALDQLARAGGPVRVETGFIEQADRFAAYQRLAGPVRRAINPNDRVAYPRALEALRSTREATRETLEALGEAWAALENELASTVALGGDRVARRTVLSDWLDAVTFHNTREFKDSYGRFLDRWGKAAEGMAADLAESAARTVLVLDEAIAEAFDEPAILPPPAPAAPPPDTRRWWHRLFGRSERAE